MKAKCVAIAITSLLLTKGWAAPMQVQGFLEPQNPALIETKNLIEAQKWQQASLKLETVKPQGELDQAWSQYLKGLILQGTDQMDDSLIPLQGIISDLRNEPEPSSDRFRVAGYALKKIGFYYRQRGDLEKAYGEHSVELEYFKKYGSPSEVHDALISLDNDAYGMKDYSLEIIVLTESIQVAQSIANQGAKMRALGMSWNNLAQTLPLIEKYGDAVDGANKSVEYYANYESIAGSSENYLVWAYYGLGSVLQLWMKHLYAGNQTKPAEEKRQQLLTVFGQALDLAKKKGITGDDLKQIRDKVECLGQSLEVASACPTDS